jgi:hypothetical protein
MQATNIVLVQGRYILITSMLLIILAIAPAAQATSLAPALDSGSDQGSQAEAPANPALSRGAMKFLEDNWYYGYAERDSQVEAEARNPAPESVLDEFDFDAMERYPGLYTEPDLDDFDFDAMERYPGLYTEPTEDDATESEETNLNLTHDRIKFLEDNWHLDSGEVFHEDDENDAASGPSSGNDADRADSLDELQNGTSEADLCEDETHDTLTYPCRGFQLHDY